MGRKNVNLTVGVFAFLGIALIAFLMLGFSKGRSFFNRTYQLRMKAHNVGGLKAQSYVLMSGVQVGTVSEISLAPDGKSVTIFLEIFKGYRVYDDARFLIEQSGFLGDQYVSIVPTKNEGRELAAGDEVNCEEPFNLQETARAAAGLLKRVDSTAKMLNDAVVDVRNMLLNEQTLTNLAATVNTMKAAAERANGAMDSIGVLFETNGPVLTHSVSNLDLSTEQIRQFANNLNGLVTTNSESLAASVKNLEQSTIMLTNVLADVHAGRGAVGTLLHNEVVAANLVAIANNLAITTSNLNRRGLWGIMWAKKPPKEEKPPDHVESPKETVK